MSTNNRLAASFVANFGMKKMKKKSTVALRKTCNFWFSGMDEEEGGEDEREKEG